VTEIDLGESLAVDHEFAGPDPWKIAI
jgi:hypothetical protein